MKKNNHSKNILCILLICLLLFASFAVISVSAAETTTVAAAELGSNTITLDGVIDDAWKGAPSQTLSLRNGTSNDNVTVKMLWNNDFLYILADITDNTNHTTNEKWWNNDAIEIVFLVANNDDDGMITRRMHLQRNGSFYGGGYFTQNTPLPTGQDNGAFWGSWKKPAYTTDKTDGWVAEFAIPVNNAEIWAGQHKNVSKLVHLDVVYYSADTTSTNRTGLLGLSANGVADSNNATLDNLAKVTLSSTKITGASITVDSDLAMNYYVNVTDDTVKADLSKLAMRFTMNDTVKTVTEYSTVNGEYVFKFDGIAAQNMGDSIKAELLYNGTVIAVKDGYSVKDNASALLTKYASDAKTVRFVTDMLNYGAAAQTYANYKADALVNNAVGMAEASTATPVDTDKLVLSGNENASLKIDSTSVIFDGVSKIGFKLYIAEDKLGSAKVKLDNDEIDVSALENLGDGYYRVSTDVIKATDFDKTFTLVLMDGETEVSKITYSINSYAFSMKDDSQQGAFALTLYRLGVSADAYNAQ